MLVSTLVPQFIVDTLQLQQLLMVTLLRHFSPLNHKDDVHILDGGQSVGNSNGRPALLKKSSNENTGSRITEQIKCM